MQYVGLCCARMILLRSQDVLLVDLFVSRCAKARDLAIVIFPGAVEVVVDLWCTQMCVCLCVYSSAGRSDRYRFIQSLCNVLHGCFGLSRYHHFSLLYYGNSMDKYLLIKSVIIYGWGGGGGGMVKS